MTRLTTELLAACVGCRPAVAVLWVEHLQRAMDRFDINTPARVGMFLANVAHESGRLRFVREIWGPTLAQMNYEGRADLGNTQTGDGRRFMGRGLIQLTGRYNARKLRDDFRKIFPDMTVPDFEATPEQMELPVWASYSAAWFFKTHGCNEYADRGDFDGVCDLINRGRKTVAKGDANGFLDRLQFWMGAEKALRL